MFRDPVVGNIVFSKYILYNLKKVTGLKMSGAFIVGTLLIRNVKVSKVSVGQWLSYIYIGMKIYSPDVFIL